MQKIKIGNHAKIRDKSKALLQLLFPVHAITQCISNVLRLLVNTYTNAAKNPFEPITIIILFFQFHSDVISGSFFLSMNGSIWV